MSGSNSRFWDRVLNVPRRWFSPRVIHLGFSEMVEEVRGMSASRMFRTQPHLRTVVTFLARNIAQLGVHAFTIEDDSDRRRDRTSPLIRAINNPNPYMTSYQLIFALVADKALYDRAYWWPRYTDQGSWEIYRLPPSWVDPVDDTFGNRAYSILGVDGTTVTVSRDRIVAFEGYHPTNLTGCSPTVTALKEVLAEQIEAMKYRSQLWQRGGKVSAVLQRPQQSSRWSPEAREAFREDWYATYTGNGPRAGGTPILEDGMTLNRIDFSATDQQYIEGLKLAYATVANAYHVNPTMVGLLENANYSNVKEFRKMLYGDTLGPLIAEIESALNSFLKPIFKAPENYYIEFNVAEKLQGDFEQQGSLFQAAVGRPWMVPNEARARQNLPRVEGGDELLLPLNMGSQNDFSLSSDISSQDTGTASYTALELKASPGIRETAEGEYVDGLRGFLAASDIRTKAKPTRSDIDTLSELLFSLDLKWATEAAQRMLRTGKVDPGLYDQTRTESYLTKKAQSTAERILGYISKTLDDPPEDDSDDWPERVFDEVESSGVERISTGLVTATLAWGALEAGRQYLASTGKPTSKTWRVTSNRPRDLHKKLHGDTVGIDETFSNGMRFPGDGKVKDPRQLAGCTCDLEINF